MKTLPLIAAVFGCGRVHFDPLVGDGAIANDGVAITGCWPRWHQHTVQFSAAMNVPFGPYDPSLAGDDVWTYYTDFSNDIWVTNNGVDFSNVTQFNSAQAEWRVTLSNDLRVAVIASGRTGGSGGVDLWMSQRDSATAGFPPPDQTLLSALNDGFDQWDPELSRDGLHLYYAPTTATGQVIMLATRQAITEPFGVPTFVDLPSPFIAPAVPTGASDPTLSPDELVMVLTLGMDVYYATRSSQSDAFGVPQPLADINTAALEADGELSADGCVFYYSSDRDGPRAIYVVYMQ